jgi:WD40 repeat protein
VDDASLTQSGVVAGTPQYMAPEQARGEPVDHRTDLFSLGSLFYAMCTGHPPFRARTNMAVLKQVAEDTPRPVRELNPECPDWLAEIIEKLHAKDSALRFQSAAEVADLLGRHLAHLQRPDTVAQPARLAVSGRAPHRQRRGRRLAGAAAVVVLAVCGLGLTEGAGVTKLVPTVIRILTPKGALVIEVDDPQVSVTVGADGQEIEIAGAGIHELRLRLGTYKWQAFRAGEVVGGDWVTVTRGEKSLVRVRPENAALQIAAPGSASPGSPAAASASGSLEVLLPARQFGPHGSNANSVAWIPGGRQFVSAGPDGTIRCWDITSGTEIRRFSGHTGPVEGVAVSAGGEYLLSCSQDKTVRLWQLATGQEIRRLVGHGGWVYGVAFSPDGKLALSAGTSWGGTPGDNYPRLWDVATGHELRRFQGHSDAVLGVAFAPDGRRALSASFDGSVRLWDVASGHELRSFAHTSRVYTVAFSPDGRRFVSGCGGSSLMNGAVYDPINCVVRLWDVDTGREVRQFRGHTAGIRTVAWSPDGRFVLSASTGEHFGVNQWQPPSEVGIRLWDAATGRQVCRFNTPNSISSLAFAADGLSFLSGGANGSIGLWELPPSLSARGVVMRPVQAGTRPAQPLVVKLRRVLRGHTDQVRSLAFTPDGQSLVSGGFDATVKLWDARTGRQEASMAGRALINALAFGPGAKMLATGCLDGSIHLWDMGERKPLATLTGHRGRVLSVAFAPDGKTLASASDDQTVKLWNLATRAERATLHGHEKGVECVRYSPDGQTLASGSWDGSVKLWDTVTGTERISLVQGPIEIRSIAFSPDGRLLATGTPVHEPVKLWGVTSGTLLSEFGGFDPRGGAVWALAFSPDGRTLAAGSGVHALRAERQSAEFGEVKLWDVATGQELATLSEPRKLIWCLGFAPDGKMLAVGSADGAIRLWDIGTRLTDAGGRWHRDPITPR